jgi:hypothetical protein
MYIKSIYLRAMVMHNPGFLVEVEVEMGRITGPGQDCQKVSETPSQQNKPGVVI